MLSHLTLGASAVLVAAAISEQILEARDLERLTRGETFADVGGARIRYRLVGPADGPVLIVFLNGLMGSLDAWDQLQPPIAEFAPSLAYDQGGAGFSRGSSAYDAAEQADELIGLLAALQIKQRLILVSFSLSSSLARVFAARHPERVAGMVLLEPHMLDQTTGTNQFFVYRTLARALIGATVRAFFGIERIKFWMRAPSVPSPFPAYDERVAHIDINSSHLYSTTRQWLATSRNAELVAGLSPPPSIPVMLMVSDRWPEESHQGDGLKNFIANKPNVSQVNMGSLGHHDLPRRPEGQRQIISALRALVPARSTTTESDEERLSERIQPPQPLV